MKTKISAFEYAIREVAEPQTLNQFEPRTEKEELELRKQKLLNTAKRMKVKQ